jgi:hypothetical protein
MKFNNKNNCGFSSIMIIAIVVLVGVVGTLGYVAYDRFIANPDSAIVEQSVTADDVNAVTASGPEAVNNTADLDQAITTLNQVTDTQDTQDSDLITSQLSEF